MSAADPTKRVLMTIGDTSDFLKKPEKNTGAASNKAKTIRFDLDLFEPDEYKFPEFNYKKLVHIEKVIWTIFLLVRDCEKEEKEEREKNPFFSPHTLFRRLLLFCCFAFHFSGGKLVMKKLSATKVFPALLNDFFSIFFWFLLAHSFD